MRVPFAAGLALFLLAGSALAAPVTVKPLALSPEAQKDFAETYGEREIAGLSDYLTKQLTRTLTAAGAEITPNAPLTIETTLTAAKPSKPTFKQLSDKPGLDYFRSVSLGGATLEARVLDGQGKVIREVGYRWYEHSLANSRGVGAWTDAERAMRRFAREVAAAYAAQHPRPAG